MWLVGVAKCQITPPLFVPELGFIPRQHRFIGVHDELYARAISVTCGEKSAIIVSADAIGFHRNLLSNGDFVEEFREIVKRATGVPKEAIMLTATHAHSTPETIMLTPIREIQGIDGWILELLEKLAKCAISSWEERKEARAYVAVGEVVGVAWSRRILGRNGKVYRINNRPSDEDVLSEPYDKDVSVLLFRREDGDIALVNFACHPVTVQVNDLISADYPGVVTEFVEKSLPNCRLCIFIQGACGNVNPVYQTTGDFADVQNYGIAIAGEIIKQIGLIRLHFGHPEREDIASTFRRVSGWRSSELTPKIEYISRKILLPERHDLPDVEQVEMEYRKALEEIGGENWWMRAERDLTDEEKKIGQKIRSLWDRWMTAIRGRDEKERTAEVQVIALGEAAIVGFSGELFVEPGIRVKTESPFQFTIVVGYANGYNGYLTTFGSFSQGGYEVSLGQWALCGDGSGDILADFAIKLLKEVYDKIWSDEGK